MGIKNRENWDFHEGCISPSMDITKDRKQLVNQYFMYMLDRTQRMFEYKGIDQEALKDTFSVRRCEELTQTNGYSFLVKIDREMNGYPKGIYCLNGFGGGIADPEGLPTFASITNVALGYSETGLRIGKDVILYPNDSMFMGFTPMFSIYSNLLADIDISLRYSLVNSRIPWIVQSATDQARVDLENMYKDIEQGQKLCTAIASNPLFDSIKNAILTTSKESLIKELIEAKQYIKANWYLDIGLQANYNMKREAINGNESGMNEDALMPLVDDMIVNRNNAWKQASEVFGIKEVKVTLSSSWKVIQDEYKQEGEEPSTEEKNEGGNDDENERH